MSQELRLRCPSCGEAAEVDEDLFRCVGCALPRVVHPVLDLCPDLRPEGFSEARRSHLQGLVEKQHFWFGPRQVLCEALIDRFQSRSAQAAVELGCGMGCFLPSLTRRAGLVVGVDGYSESLEAAAAAAPEALCLKADVCRVPMDGGQFDLVVALDVAEHLDDRQFFLEAARLAKPGACLLTTVPACPALWSDLDEAAGHRRRYTKRGLAELLKGTGWRPMHLSHYQFLLFPLVWLVRRRPAGGARRLERTPQPWMGALLGSVNRFEVNFLSRLRLPWGSSVVAMARKAE